MNKKEIKFLSAVNAIKEVLMELEPADAKDVVEVLPHFFNENLEEKMAALKCVREIFDDPAGIILPFKV